MCCVFTMAIGCCMSDMKATLGVCLDHVNIYVSGHASFSLLTSFNYGNIDIFSFKYVFFSF